MKIITICVLSCISFLLLSCLAICESRSCMYILNNTKDTILIGISGYNAKYNVIDSVGYFLDKDSADYREQRTELDGRKKLKLGSSNLIPPHASGSYDAWSTYYGPRLGGDNGQKGYFFIIRLDDARNYTWDEICKKKLYKMLVVTGKMLEQGNVINYESIQ